MRKEKTESGNLAVPRIQVIFSVSFSSLKHVFCFHRFNLLLVFTLMRTPDPDTVHLNLTGAEHRDRITSLASWPHSFYKDQLTFLGHEPSHFQLFIYQCPQVLLQKSAVINSPPSLH